MYGVEVACETGEKLGIFYPFIALILKFVWNRSMIVNFGINDAIVSLFFEIFGNYRVGYLFSGVVGSTGPLQVCLVVNHMCIYCFNLMLSPTQLL